METVVGVLGELLHTLRAHASERCRRCSALDVVAAAAPPRDVAQVRARRGCRSRRTARGGCWSMASHRRSSAAMRSSNQCRTAGRRLRSGVAVRPSSSTGCRWSSSALVGGRRGVVELVDDHDVEVVGIDVSSPDASRLWIDAKTCSKRSGVRRPPTARRTRGRAARAERARGSGRGSPRGGRRRAAARAAASPAARVVERGHHRLAGAGGGDEQVAVVTRVRASSICSSSAPGTARAQLDRAQDDRGPTRRRIALVELGTRRTGRSRRRPVALEDGGDLLDHARRLRAPRRARSTRARHLRRVVRFEEPTYAVEKPDSRWNSQALACRRVVLVS
jgi:hypothetical protein